MSPFPCPRHRQQAGFTLLELIVAISIFAVISLIAYGGLSNILETRQHLEQQSERIARLQRAFMILGRDLEQVVDREVRDSFGALQASVQTDEYGENLLSFTRHGWSNPFPVKERPRSNLQRVRYQLRDGRLIRSHYDVLDLAPDSESYDNPLLEGVSSVKLRFLQVVTGNGGSKTDKWHDRWPLRDADSKQAARLPHAIEITIDLEDEGEIQRLYAVPGASS